LKTGGIESSRFPRERRSLSFERSNQGCGVVTVDWRLGPRIESGVHSRVTFRPVTSLGEVRDEVSIFDVRLKIYVGRGN
jgi:hypothetical protein